MRRRDQVVEDGEKEVMGSVFEIAQVLVDQSRGGARETRRLRIRNTKQSL